MKKTDKKAALLKTLQAELNRRRQVENEAIRLISSGECEKACELLDSLDDQIVKDIDAKLDNLDQESEETEDVESNEQTKQFLRKFLLDTWAHLVVALQQKDVASFEWVIQRHAEKLSKLQNGK